MRTIVGLFDSWPQAQSAVADLEASGFSRSDISVIAPSDSIDSASGAGTAIGAGLGLLAGLSVIAVPGIGAIAVLGPILAGGLLGAVAGGLVGSLVDAGIPEHEAHHYAEGVRRGGTLVTVAASDNNTPRAIEIISRHRPVDLNERVLLWRADGWTPGMTPGQLPRSAPVGNGQPDPSGRTTMGDAAAAMPAPDGVSLDSGQQIGDKVD
jgi:hypothetical protein